MRNNLIVRQHAAVTQDDTVIRGTGQYHGRFPDAINCSEAGTVELTDHYGNELTVTLAAGWNAQGFRSIGPGTSVTTVIAGWCDPD